MILVPLRDRRMPEGQNRGARPLSGNGAKINRGEGRAEGRCANFPWLFVAGLGHDADDIDIARLALINAHARRGIAFHMLDSVKAFAHGKADIIQRDIILNVDKGLVTGL